MDKVEILMKEIEHIGFMLTLILFAVITSTAIISVFTFKI